MSVPSTQAGYIKYKLVIILLISSIITLASCLDSLYYPAFLFTVVEVAIVCNACLSVVMGIWLVRKGSKLTEHIDRQDDCYYNSSLKAIT